MTTEAQTIADIAVKAFGVPTVMKTEEGREFLVLPEGMKSQDVTEANGVAPLLPDFIKQAVTLQTVDSLVDYVNGFKGETTLLFADMHANSIKALLDYHGADVPKHVSHVATMALPFSEEWRTWAAIDGRLLPQLDFARFLEENASDVAAPSGADLLEACRDLQARRKVNFTKAIRTSSDNENFEFTDETEAKTRGGLEIPTKVLLSLPVYFGEAPTELYAFLRWKLDDGQLTLGVKLHRAEHVRQAVFKQIVVAAAERTERRVVFGKAG